MKKKNKKPYIKTNLANSFIKSFKFYKSSSNFFIKKRDNSFGLYVNNHDLNYLIIKNQYQLP